MIGIILVLIRPYGGCRFKEGRGTTVYRYMDCTVRESLGTKFLEASAPSKQTPPFLTLYAETRFWHFKEQTPFKKIQKTSAILCEVETV
jgi:hypothetical protein